MKVSKKLMSILLAAVMLISVIPFQAMAADTYAITISTQNGEKLEDSKTYKDDDGIIAPGEVWAYFIQWQKDAFETNNAEELFADFKGTFMTLVNTKFTNTTAITDDMRVVLDFSEDEFDIIVIEGAVTKDSSGSNSTPTPPETTTTTVSLWLSGGNAPFQTGSAKTTAQTTLNDILKEVLGAKWAESYSIDNWNINGGDLKNTNNPTDVCGNPNTMGISLVALPPKENPDPAFVDVTLDYTDGAESASERYHTISIVDGQRFGDKLPAKPQRAGMTFVKWVYTTDNSTVTPEDTFDATKGTVIKAVWNVEKLFLTLDENRQGEEYVNYGVSVTQGEAIWPKVSKYSPERKGYVFMGWYLNGAKITPETIYDLGDSATAYAKWEKAMEPGVAEPPEKDGKVYLEIYANGKTGDLIRRVEMPASAIKDEIITRAEVEAVAKKYVTPKTGYKLGYDGIFTEDTWYTYTRDGGETKGAARVEVSLYNDTYLFVMVKNVKNATNYDPTNPKTGDYILTTGLTLMAISGIAAAAVYVTGKKRAK